MNRRQLTDSLKNPAVRAPRFRCGQCVPSSNGLGAGSFTRDKRQPVQPMPPCRHWRQWKCWPSRLVAGSWALRCSLQTSHSAPSLPHQWTILYLYFSAYYVYGGCSKFLHLKPFLGRPCAKLAHHLCDHGFQPVQCLSYDDLADTVIQLNKKRNQQKSHKNKKTSKEKMNKCKQKEKKRRERKRAS